MTNNPLTITIRNSSANVVILDINGDITNAAEEQLNSAYEEASSQQPQALILNFEGLDYMNSSGIGLLVTMLIRTQRAKQRLLAFGLSEHYLQIFELTRLNEAIEIHPDEAAAVSAVATPA
ncbi:MAG: STAS domain-containing protein [Anaerolineales bacterium]|nr:STAS domain-containing protein [Anaerolineales bacterium]